MNLTMRQKSALVRAAERGLDRSRGDYILAGVGYVGMVVMLVLAVMGVV